MIVANCSLFTSSLASVIILPTRAMSLARRGIYIKFRGKFECARSCDEISVNLR